MRRSPEVQRLRMRQLAERLAPWETVKSQPFPKRGWISAFRHALGMGPTQLARRMGIDPTGVVHLERREEAGKITVESLQRAAEAMDAKLVYAIVPNQSLASTMHAQARKVARARLGRVAHTMSLEAQDVEDNEAARQEADLTTRLLVEWPRSIWDEPEDMTGSGRK